MDKESISVFENRKKDHIRHALNPKAQATAPTGLSSISLIHEALPNLDLTEVSLTTRVLGRSWRTPLYVSSMTAGHQEAPKLNRVLARVCQKRGWALGVGSQRRQLTEPETEEWNKIREEAPDVFLMGNIGLSQLINTPVEKITRLVTSLGARAMTVHTNPLQESIQAEGTPNFRGGLHALKNLARDLRVPVVLKETGTGFSRQTLERLIDSGVSAVDVSGMGGTHWGRVEGLRAPTKSVTARLGETFSEWGHSTVESVLNGRTLPLDYEIWASGGVRTGLDAAKLLALGATAVGLAQPVLEAALKGEDELEKYFECVERELVVAMFCTGCASIEDLRKRAVWRRN